jgi:hypothetical protein
MRLSHRGLVLAERVGIARSDGGVQSRGTAPVEPVEIDAVELQNAAAGALVHTREAVAFKRRTEQGKGLPPDFCCIRSRKASPRAENAVRSVPSSAERTKRTNDLVPSRGRIARYSTQ